MPFQHQIKIFHFDIHLKNLTKSTILYYCDQFKGVRKNLHIILITDFTHEDFFNRWECNPVLLRRCRTIWLSDWSTETKLAVVNTLSKSVKV